jgi:hypothetical protein
MLIEGLEHVALAYDDDTGCGMTLCKKKICPGDLGPRMEESITCPECLKIQAATEGLADRIVARLREWRGQYDLPGQGGEMGALVQSAIDSAIRITQQEGRQP